MQPPRVIACRDTTRWAARLRRFNYSEVEGELARLAMLNGRPDYLLLASTLPYLKIASLPSSRGTNVLKKERVGLISRHKTILYRSRYS